MKPFARLLIIPAIIAALLNLLIFVPILST